MSPRRRRYSLEKLQVVPTDSQETSWPLMREPVSGIEHTYAVMDGNEPRHNEWRFTVRVPADRTKYIEVRPSYHPNLKAWAELQDRSLLFARCTLGRYRGLYYCQFTLADPTGEKTRRRVRPEDRDRLDWLGIPPSIVKLKKNVRQTRGTDGDALVIIVRPLDYAMMIKLFFATKVWVLKEGFTLEG
jgi:hypothetical protein